MIRRVDALPMKPVLFVAHDAGRTGAPMVLLHLCRWLARHHAWPFEIVLGDGGDLEADFAALAPTTVVGREADPRRALIRLQAIAARVARGEFSLLYANTVETGELLEVLASPATPVLVHVHELEFWMAQHTGVERLRLVTDRCDRFIAVSDAVRANLVTRHGIPPASIDVVHEFIDVSQWPEVRDADPALRRRLGIPDTSWIVGSAGTLDWRKGPDLFVQVAGAVHRMGVAAPVHWVWIGGWVGSLYAAGLRHDANRLGLGPRMHFVGQQSEPAALFGLLDVFLSTSREDPFPIVNLEAAASGTPVVCFDGAGGAREFVEDDCGAIVPYLDVKAMGDRVIDLLSADARRYACGDRARAKVRTRHDVSVVGPRIVAIMESVVRAGPTPRRLASGTAVTAALASRWTRDDPVLLGMYGHASAYAANGQPARARAIFEAVIDEATASAPDVAGKAWFKLATLEVAPRDAIRCCTRSLELLPSHEAAQRLLERLQADEALHE
jgi:glycosyltransferase involved in cell wall biosynthesis